jgi:hypothetical protein
MAEIMLGLSENEWKELKSQQLEYNIRQSKIIDKMDKEYDYDPPKDQETTKSPQA